MSQPDRGKARSRIWVFLGCLLLCSCTAKRSPVKDLHRLKRPMMGTLVEVVWRTRGEATEIEAVRSTLDRMETLASRMNLYGPESELTEINAAAGKVPVKVSDELFDLIEKSQVLSRMTGGAFDPTVGTVEAVWGDIQRGGGGRLPEKEAVEAALDRVGYQHVRTDPVAKTVFLVKEGMRLDLGGIAKGYITDQGMAWLNKLGIETALIDAGGDIRAYERPESPPWRVGLQDPLEREHLLGVFLLRGGAVVTSGTYERYFETEEGRFAHILNPITGQPVAGLLSVTVIAEEAFLADALATALMVKGRKDGIALLRRFPSVRGVFVEPDGAIWIEDGLRDVLRLNPLPSRNTLRFYSSVPVPGDNRR